MFFDILGRGMSYGVKFDNEGGVLINCVRIIKN